MHRLALCLVAVLAPLSIKAETGPAVRAELSAITVSTPRGHLPPFDMAGAVDHVAGQDIRNARMQAQLSEGLAGIPGLLLRDRHNHAQDLQLSIRGFGARATYGVRGVRLYVDGIPATLPDGQGQTSHIDIASLERVEVLRGPVSVLYGNASGGVLQAFTAQGSGPPRLGYEAASGRFGTWRQGLQASGSHQGVDYLLSLNRFHTDGWREHSAATRDLVNARLGLALTRDSRLSIVFNQVHVDAQDPLGLTASQFATAPRAAPLATQYNTRKTVRQHQAGLLWTHQFDARRQLQVMAYGGQRKTVQFQSIPPAAQQNPLHSGGVIDLRRHYGGLDVRWFAAFDLGVQPVELVAGLSHDTLHERRRGYENYLGSPQAPLLGERGRLRRQERNRVSNLAPYAHLTWHLSEHVTFETGLRYSDIRFRSTDQYVVGPNGDDSGRARYRRALPAAALRWQAMTDVALYLSAGRGFETPTLNELSYRPDGAAGLNFALQPSVNDTVELGAKVRIATGQLNLALFHTRTRDEIVAAGSSGGRSTFQNAGRTWRQGFELGWQHETANHWRTRLALSWLDARLRDGFCTPVPCTGDSNVVAAGSRIPGTAAQSLFASIDWIPPQGWRAGLELRALGRFQANHRNTASAAGYAVAALWAGYVRQWADWELTTFARIDNLFDRRYAGSLIVNESNARYFEPAPGRNWTAGISLAYRFR